MQYVATDDMCTAMIEKVVSWDSLLKAAHQCGNGVRWKATTQGFEMNKLRWISNLRDEVLSGKYKGRGFNDFTICDRGKVRHIQSVHISERTIQKSLVQNVLCPLIAPTLIYDNSATLKGKGTEFAIKRFRHHLSHHYRKHGLKGGVLIMDWKNYFASIDHKILLDMLRQKIKDDEAYELCKTFITNFDGDKGLGLGSEISQICAVFYPNKIDHYVKEHLHIEGYGRYMDDLYVISESIEKLKEAQEAITRMSEELKLTVKPSTIVKFDGGHFTFLKKRFHFTKTGKIIMRITPANIRRRRRKLKNQKKKLDENTIDIDSVSQSYQSWRAYAMKCNSYKTVKRMDSYYSKLFPEGEKRWVM